MLGKRFALALVVVSLVGLVPIGVIVLVHRNPRPLTTLFPVRLTIQGGCPRSIARIDGVVNPDRRSLERILAPGGSSVALVCEYTPLNVSAEERPGTLRKAVQLRGSQLVSLIGTMNSIPHVATPRNARVHCSEEIGANDVIVLGGYKGRSDVDLLFHRSGCQNVTNGYIIRWESDGPAFAVFERVFQQYVGP